MSMRYNRFSPYRKTQQSSWYLGYWEPRNISKHSTDREFKITAKYDERPGSLAKDLYGSEKLWWVFAQRNPDIIKDPIYDMKSGRKIYVPSRERLLQLLSN